MDEEYFFVLHVRDDCRQIALDLQQRRGGRLEVYAQLVGDNVGQRRVPQPRRLTKKHMIHGLAARARRLNRYRQIFFELSLTNKLAEPLRTQLQFKRRIVLDRRGRDQTLGVAIQIGIVLGSGHSPDVTTNYMGTSASAGRPFLSILTCVTFYL